MRTADFQKNTTAGVTGREVPMQENRFPEECRYTAEHVWVRRDGDEVTAGISWYAQEQLGEILFVDLVSVGEEIRAGEAFGTVESLKSVSTLFMPLDGVITAINNFDVLPPTTLNRDPYGAGWMIRFRPASPDTFMTCLTAQEYAAMLPDA